ncbi:MAG: phosphoribosyltransferase [Gammaproteobacteria bacterium]|nr:phosphoribosyltransferase [Gammaproteobacteria bacterium]
MRFLYKIYSNYDGFRPAVLPERMDGRRLRLLGWRRYIDVVEKGWECWVYFHGRHRFENGVYAKGIVDGIDLEAGEVSLRVREYRTDRPITPRETSARVAEAVSTRFRQVFLWPDDWTVAPVCEPSACTGRQCEDCETWLKLPLIGEGESRIPSRLRWSTYDDVVAAHWIVPRRCYETRIRSDVRDLTRRFTEFKLGEMAYAFPFALAIFEQLRRRDLLEFDYVVPIPLSPDKAANGEKHRTRELARELGGLLAVRVGEMLSLSESVSKRRMQADGYTVSQFEGRYGEALQASVPPDARRILLVDDVMTRGSTAAQALRVIEKQQPHAVVVVATAGQMIVKEAVVDDEGFTLSG